MHDLYMALTSAKKKKRKKDGTSDVFTPGQVYYRNVAIKNKPYHVYIKYVELDFLLL